MARMSKCFLTGICSFNLVRLVQTISRCLAIWLLVLFWVRHDYLLFHQQSLLLSYRSSFWTDCGNRAGLDLPRVPMPALGGAVAAICIGIRSILQ